MTSNNIYTLPYFYIIQHKESKKMYAGAKWAKGCHPNEFMQPDGYQTSSNTITDIIDQEGLGSFEVLRLETDLGGLTAYDYETLFLQENDCAGSDNWYNGHNNAGMAFGTNNYKQLMVDKYGVENPSQIKDFQDKKVKTCLENFGVEYSLKSQIVKDKIVLTCLEKYGVEHNSQSQIVKDKKVKTCLENWGYEYSSQSLNNKNKSKITCLENWGYEYSLQNPELRKKGSETKLKKYGDEKYNNREKCKITKLKSQGDEKYNNREKCRETLLKNHNVENASQIKFLSIIGIKKTYSKNIISRDYPEFKKYY